MLRSLRQGSSPGLLRAQGLRAHGHRGAAISSTLSGNGSPQRSL